MRQNSDSWKSQFITGGANRPYSSRPPEKEQKEDLFFTNRGLSTEDTSQDE